MNHCPCCSGKLYEECCGLYISGKKPAPSAETLMRSRYTAYTKADMDYIERTMKGPAALSFNRIESEKWARASEWEKLEVLRSQEIANTGIVEFIVYFSLNKQKQTLHETSKFVCEQGEWFYVDAMPEQKLKRLIKIGRNEPCPCGSGKKYKKCCASEKI